MNILLSRLVCRNKEVYASSSFHVHAIITFDGKPTEPAPVKLLLIMVNIQSHIVTQNRVRYGSFLFK